MGTISFSAACSRTLPDVLFSRPFSNTSEYFLQKPFSKYLYMPCSAACSQYLQMSWSVACSRTLQNVLLSRPFSNISKYISQQLILENPQMSSPVACTQTLRNIFLSSPLSNTCSQSVLFSEGQRLWMSSGKIIMYLNAVWMKMSGQ